MTDVIIVLLFSVAFVCWGGYNYELGKQKVYSEWNKWIEEITKRKEESEAKHE